MSRILVVDDEPSICWSFEQILSESGHAVTSASSAELALQAMEAFAPELIVLDFRLPGMDGLSLIRKLRDLQASPPVILMTAFGSLDLAVQALGEGVFDYLPKPFDLDQAVSVVTRALTSLEQHRTLAASPQQHDPAGEMLGTSRGMQEVFRQIALVAPLNVPVLITGESGVGKELVARAVHRYSGRSPDRFIPICVPALSTGFLESELFGHVPGAFTGTEPTRPGLLQQAHQGTIFFDEIGDIPLSQQARLLRVLEDRHVFPVGGDRLQDSEFRLIAATNQQLDARIQAGTFRQDLYYRLNVFRIHVPPLRERQEDIPALATRFLSQIEAPEATSFSPETMDELMNRSWPGNVRELRSVIQHAAVVCRGGVITPDCLPEPTEESAGMNPLEPEQIRRLLRRWADQQIPTIHPDDPATLLYEQFLEAFEPPILQGALEAAKGNRKSAADLLGLHRETLRKRLRRHGLEDGEQSE